MLLASDTLPGRAEMTAPYLVDGMSGARRGSGRPVEARHYKLLMISPADATTLHQALLKVRPAEAGGHEAELVLAIDSAGAALRLAGPLLQRPGGCQLVLAEAAGGPTVLTLAIGQPIQRRTAGRLDGLLTLAGWPEPATLLAGRCLLRRLSARDHAILLGDGHAGPVAAGAPGAQRTLAHLRRRLEGPHLQLV